MSEPRLADDQLKVGDLCEIVADESGCYGHLVGLECTILAPLAVRRCFAGRTFEFLMTYEGQCSDGRIYLFRPHELRKKRPPRDDVQLAQWSECPWQPERITA